MASHLQESSSPKREDERNVETTTSVDTGGGAYVHGNVRTDGDFVGRDKNIFNVAVHHLDERIVRRFGLGMTGGFLLTGLVTVVAAAWLAWTLQPARPAQMVGRFNVAVAQFAHFGDRQDRPVRDELSQLVFQELQQKLGQGFTIWGPERTGSVKGDDLDARLHWAAELADEIRADVVVFGEVDTSSVPWQITPYFYVSPRATKGFGQANLIVGKYALGMPIDIGRADVVDRERSIARLTARVDLLVDVVRGIAYFGKRDMESLEEARATFERVAADWQDEDGIAVIYQLLGATAGKAYEMDEAKSVHYLDAAQDAYERAIAADADYARAYLGLASVYYLRAIRPVTDAQSFDQVDWQMLAQAVETYEKAAAAEIQSEQEEIDVRVEFGLGQCDLLRAQAGQETFEPAIRHFQRVVEVYDRSQNPALKQLSAEAHGRLGLIYSQFTHTLERAIKEYETAALLSVDYEQRRRLFEARAQELRDQIRNDLL